MLGYLVALGPDETDRRTARAFAALRAKVARTFAPRRRLAPEASSLKALSRRRLGLVRFTGDDERRA